MRQVLRVFPGSSRTVLPEAVMFMLRMVCYDFSHLFFVTSCSGTHYVERQSGISVSCSKAALKSVPTKSQPSSNPAQQQLVVHICGPHTTGGLLQRDLGDDGIGDSSTIISTEIKPQFPIETPPTLAPQSDPNHLMFLASSRVELSANVLPRKDFSNNEIRHHHPASIIPKAQGLLARLERDASKFTQHTLPLHAKSRQRSERRHQRVILGADALRAQKIDI
jgi:hypothetical protein